MKKALLLTLFFVLIVTLGFSQTDRFWSANSEARSSIITDKGVARLSFPKEFKLFNLNIESLRQELFSIVGSQARKQTTVISLPNAAGGFEEFEVNEASNFEPSLQAKFPEIRAYSGRGITDRYATLKLSISPQGIQTMIFRTEKQNEFIEAYSKNHDVYAVFTSSREKGKLPWTCTTEDKALIKDVNSQIGSSNFTNSKRYVATFTNDLSRTFTVSELNGIFGNTIQLQLDPRRNYNFEARITSSINNVVQLVSNKVTFTARPFPPPPKVPTPFGNELFIVGGATPGGWNNPVPVPTQKMTRLSSTKYEIIVNLSSDFYLLLPQNGSWSNKYAVANKTLPGLGNGGDFGYNLNDDIPAPSVPGTYKLTFDFQLGKFTAVKQ